MAERKSWGDYYEGAGGVEYLLDHIAIHKEFIAEILNRRPSAALEAGCGSAIMSVFLAMAGVKVTACDRDDAVLAMAARTAERWNAHLDIVKADIMSMNFKTDGFDVVFSQGVLEHMTDEQIRRASIEALRVAPVFVFSVPGHYYKHKDFGDERLLNAPEWRRILGSAGKLELRPYYFRRTKRNALMKRPLMLMGVLSRP
jgi:2-polyprenyl-3-methyl-5-hydroxy-6-metoxy-1,4-benzoquinol methylase